MAGYYLSAGQMLGLLEVEPRGTLPLPYHLLRTPLYASELVEGLGDIADRLNIV